MKRIIKKFSSGLTLILVLLAALVLVACGKKTKKTEFVNKGEVGSYYQYDEQEKSLVLDAGNVTFNNGNKEIKGTYSYDGEKLVITIDGACIETTYSETTIGFTYAGNEYLLYKSVDYTLSFESNGGSAVESMTVKNGMKANKPANPTKDEYVFAGWYKDAGFTQEFNFSTEIITRDTKLYAKYESDNEINVFFETGIEGVTVNKVRTVDHVVKGLPELNVEGKTFIGWFYSDYGTADRLSRVFKVDTLIDDEITLYAVFEGEAPVVSVESDKIYILGSSAEEFVLTITNTDDEMEIYRNVVLSTTVEISMASLPPANYVVSAQAGGKTGSAYVDNSDGEWEAEEYKVVLDYQYFDKSESSEETVTLGLRYNLPVPQAENSLMAFVGWYSAQNAQGLRYADETGASLGVWYDRKDVKLYAAWKEVLSFELINNDTEYQVKKGLGISYVKEVTIPATYNGKPVSTVAASAFSMCQNLLVINIPNSIKNVEIGANGPTGTGSAFSSCTKLTAVNVYEVEGFNKELAVYESVDGSLLYHSETMGVELVWFPYYTYTGTYRVSDKVEVLPMYCFRSSNKITEIVVPATVRLVDYGAFYSCTGLLKVTFEEPKEGVTAPELELGEKIFASSSLVEVTLPSRLRSFSSNLFSTVPNLTTVNINRGVGEQPYLSEDGIVYNSDMTELLFCPRARAGVFTTPVGVSTIGESAFEKCINLSKVVISGQIATIGVNAFKDCTGIIEIEFKGEAGDVNLTIKEGAFSGLTNPQFVEVTLPANLVALEKAAFGGCSSLLTVRLTSVANTVDFADGAFGTNAAVPLYYVTDLYIGKDVASFEISSVFGSTSLVSVEVEEGNKNYVSVDGVLYNTEKTLIAYFPAAKEGEYVILDTVTSIGSNIFEERRYLTKITIPASVTSIGNEAFKNCSGLREVVFAEGGNSNLDIGYYVFQGCSKLNLINLPSRLRTIGEGAFYDVNGLTEIVIPEGCETIGDKAFQYSSKLVRIVIPASVKNIVESESTITGDTEPRIRAFDNCESLSIIEVANGNINYAAIDGLLYKIVKDSEGNVLGKQLIICPAGKGGKITVPNDVIRIANRAFYGNKLIEEVVFTGEVEQGITLGLNTFYGNDNLKKIVLPEGIGTIATSSITNCKSLTSITIPGSVEIIQKLSIVDCINLTDLIFIESDVPLRIQGEYKNESSLKLGAVIEHNSAFKNTKISYLNIPERTIELGDSLFADNKLITEITIPKNVVKIGNAAFSGTINLKKVTFEEGSNLQNLCGETARAFAGQSDVFYNSGIEEIILPDSLLKIGTRAFGNCLNLRKIYIPAGVSEIPGMCFLHTPSLEEVTFGENSVLKTIGTRAFSFSGIKNISLPKSLEVVGIGAFILSDLENITFEADENGVSSLKQILDTAFEYTNISEFRFPYTGITGDVYNTIDFGTATSKKIFEGCKNLETIYVTESVSSLSDIIERCTSLKTVIISQGNTGFKLDEDQPIIYSGDDKMVIKVYGPLTGEIRIPDIVTKIEDSAFYGQTGITKVIIPATVREIGDYAFYRCTSLETVIFENNEVALELGKNLFALCTSLKNVSLSSNISYIPSYMFLGCSSLESITIPTTVSQIGDGAFARCPKLKMETLPATVTTLGTSTFYGSGITKFALPEGLSVIGNYTFKECADLTEVSFPSTLAQISDEACGACTSLTKVTIAEGVRRIGSSFSGCTALEEITLPESLQYMVMASYSDSTFSGYLTKLPTTTSALSSTCKTFYGCANLRKVTFANGGTSLEAIGANTFEGCTNLTDIVLPAGLKVIGNQAFAECSSLEAINIPAGVKVLGGSATIGKTFVNCVSLKEITLPDELVSLFGYVFSGCTSLERIVIPGKVTKLGNYIFENCTGLKEAEIDGVIATKGTYVFTGCSSLEKVTINDNNVSLGNYMFLNCTGLKEFKFPSKYTAAAATTAINVFQGCSALESITLPTNVGYVGNNFFDGCSSLKKVTFMSTQITGIGNYAFANCSSLTEISIPQLKTPTALGNNAFENCVSLGKVEINSSIQAIGDYAFKGCTALTAITLPAELKTIGTEAFAGTGLVSIMIPAKVTAIGSDAKGGQFKDCANLEEVVFLGDIEAIGAYAFNGCSSLETIEIPSSVSYIGQNAFSASGLKAVVIPTSVAKIYGGAFNDCILLESLSLNDLFSYENGLLINKNTNTIVGIDETVTDIVIPEGMGILQSSLNAKNKINSITLPTTFTEIPNNMFQGANVKKIIIQSEVKVGVEAFKDSTVEEIVGAENIVSIAKSAFENASSLKTIALSNKLIAIDGSAFKNSGLESITVPGTVKWLGTEGDSSKNGEVFANCANLATITLEEGIEHINASAFKSSGITSIVIPASVEDLGTETLAACPALKDVVFNGVIAEGTFSAWNKLVAESRTFVLSPYESIESVVINGNVQAIPDGFFLGLTSLKTLVLPNTIESIGNRSFYACQSLTEITIPSKVKFISPYAFYGCESVEYLHIPSNVLIADKFAFAYCTSLKKVDIEEGLMALGEFGAYTADGTNRSMGSTLTIEGSVFLGCEALEEINLPSTLKVIGSNTFSYCTNVTEIVIPKSVAYIGSQAFAGWTSSQTVNFEPSLYDATNLYYFPMLYTFDPTYYGENEATFVYDYKKNK